MYYIKVNYNIEKVNITLSQLTSTLKIWEENVTIITWIEIDKNQLLCWYLNISVNVLEI